ncbi:MAG: hypothetical protein AMS26_09570 [Bacteroides sp. SM23_62]|jgi:hypothetical protein|nr:MAG: hypothetical protein AMS26_09570 [Bacteroides sp. SM23_62]
MKRMFFIICLIGFAAAVFAQNKSIDRVFDKYAGQEGFTTVYISKYMFNMFADLEGAEDEEIEEVQKVFGKLTGIKILASEDGSPKGINFYDEIMKDLPREKYEELMVVKDSESDVIFLAREESGVIVELLLIVSGDDDNALIAITGEIDLNTIAKLSKAMDIEGMEELENLEEK